MPFVGVQSPGDTIEATGGDIIVVREPNSSDPNAQPSVERVPNSYTFPSTSNTSDGNADDPTSDDSSGKSGEVTPEVLQGIRDIVSRHGNFRCVECAAEIEEYLKERGIPGRRIELDVPYPRTDADGNIYDDSLPPDATDEPNSSIATNGHHEGIAVNINGEEIVFDNHHPDGVPYEQWKENLVFDSKVRFGADFVESGYSF